jgi:AraC-like DNA-binding protein
MLRYFAADIDNKTASISKIVSQLSQNHNLKKMAAFKQPVTTKEKFELTMFANNEFSFSNFLENFAKSYFLYLPNSNTVVRYGGYSSLESAYDEYVTNNSIAPEQWRVLLGLNYYKRFVSLGGDDILFIHTIGESSKDVLMNFCVIINGDYIKDVMNSLNYSKRSGFLMIDDKDKIIYSYNFNPESNPFSYDMLQEQGKGTEWKIDGKNVVVSYFQSQTAHIKYVLIAPANEYWDKAVNAKNIFIISVLLSIFVALVFSLFFSYRHYRPIGTLTEMLKYSDSSKENEQKFIIDAVRGIITEREAVRNQIKEDEQRRQKFILARLIQGKRGSSSYREMLDKYNINFPDGCFTVIIFSLDDYEDFFEDSFSSDCEYLAEYAVIRVVEEFISRHYKCDIVQVHDYIVCIVNFLDLSNHEVEDELIHMMEILKEIFQNELYIRITVAISGLHKNAEDLHIAYTEALRALEKRIIIGENSIIRYSAGDLDSDLNAKGYFYCLETEVKLLNNIKLGNKQEALSILDQIFDENLSSSKLSVDMIKYLMYDLTGTIFKAFISLNYVEPQGTNLLTKIMGCATVLETRQMLRESISDVCDFVNSEKKSHNVELLKDIIGYIKENYSDTNLCNSQIAERFGIKASYLSVFFKEQTGENILSFIHKTRINQAKFLLAEKSYTIEEVSSMVGYNNSVALIRNFKKYEGITPGEFKNKFVKTMP